MNNLFTTAAEFLKKSTSAIYFLKGLWKEHTIALLLSPRDNDKTEKISEIIDDITVSRQLLYVNTENRADSLIGRFGANPNLTIFTPFYQDPEDPKDYADLVISGIEEAVSSTDIRTFIVDSVTRIAARSFGRNASPTYVMKRLSDLQSRHNLSLLVVAHSSTKSADRALKNLSDTELIDDPESTSPTCTQPPIVGSRPVATAEKENTSPTCPQPTESRFSTCASPEQPPIVGSRPVATAEKENATPTCAQPTEKPEPKPAEKPKPEPQTPTLGHKLNIHMFPDDAFWSAPDNFDYSDF